MEIVLDGSKITTREEFHSEIKALLNFPDYYGKNLDALWDCLTEIELPVTLIWTDFDKSKANIRDYADGILTMLKDFERDNDNFKVILD